MILKKKKKNNNRIYKSELEMIIKSTFETIFHVFFVFGFINAGIMYITEKILILNLISDKFEGVLLLVVSLFGLGFSGYILRRLGYLSLSTDEPDHYRNYLLKELEILNEVRDYMNKTDKPKKKSGDDTKDFDSKEVCNETTENDEQYSQNHEEIEAKKDNETKKNIIRSMLKNNDEIDEYFTISKTQSKWSFLLSILSCVIGLIVLAVGIYSVLILKNTEIAVISVIGGAVLEVVSGTVIVLHSKSALQLNHYYNALHENERFLSAVQMVDRLNDENQEIMLMEIIRKQIDITPEKSTEEVNRK